VNRCRIERFAEEGEEMKRKWSIIRFERRKRSKLKSSRSIVLFERFLVKVDDITDDLRLKDNSDIKTLCSTFTA
jgi:hypothetical protein